MNETEVLRKLKEENARLREENEALLKIIAQMKVTLNRLINRYIAGEKANAG